MDTAKRSRLESAGFHATTVADFLGLTPDESEWIELKLALWNAFRKQRETSRLSRAELAERIGTNPARVAKMEAGHPSINLDLMIRGLLAMGMTRRELAQAIALPKD